jgi:hypothetical protein
MTKRGRPPILDETKRREVVAILSTGCSQASAADYVGCSVSTIRRTLQRDPLFAQAIGRARSNAEVSLVRNIRRAAEDRKYWRAAAWALQHFFPVRYRDGLPTITPEQLAQVLAQFAELIVEQVPVERYRKKILKAIEAFLQNLGGTIPKQSGPLEQPDGVLLLDVPSKKENADAVQ